MSAIDQRAGSAEAAPPAPWFHLIDNQPPLVLLLDGSQLFELERELFDALRQGQPEAMASLEQLAPAGRQASPSIPSTAPLALSLNLAQACNLACSYCYAGQGDFGRPPRLMSEATALAAIDQLLQGAAGQPVTIGFIGGEPLLNRRVLHRSVEHALTRSVEAGTRAAFSITTNGTLLTEADAELFRRHRFTVTVSIDGAATTNDRHRPRRHGGGSFAAAEAMIVPLLRRPGGARISARATVARDDLDVAARVEALCDLGFSEVGVCPVRSGPDPSLVLRGADWPRLLDAMIAAAERDLARATAGLAPRFSNLWIALKQIHRGAYRALPCGSAASYVSLGADGRYFTCHRTIEDDRFALGSIAAGIDHASRLAFLAARQVDRQEPCGSCWARYLCGGGCHAEVAAAGRTGCDFIRGWLEYCLVRYDDLLRRHPSIIEAWGP